MPPPAMRPLKLRLRSSPSTLKISGPASANNPHQMFPQVMVNNQPLNNPPRTAGGANQIQAPPPNPQGPSQPPSTASANAGPSGNQIQPLPPNPQVPNQPPSTASANAGLSGNQIQAPPLNPQGPNQPPSTASANAGLSGNQIQTPPLNPQGPNQPPATASANAGPSANQIQPLPANPLGYTNLPLWSLPVLVRQEAQRRIILAWRLPLQY